MVAGGGQDAPPSLRRSRSADCQDGSAGILPASYFDGQDAQYRSFRHHSLRFPLASSASKDGQKGNQSIPNVDSF